MPAPPKNLDRRDTSVDPPGTCLLLHIMYSSIIKSPITHTFRLLNFLITFNLIILYCDDLNSLGVFQN